MELTALTRVGNHGHEVYAFELKWAGGDVKAADFKVVSADDGKSGQFGLNAAANPEVESVSVENGILRIDVTPYLCNGKFKVVGPGIELSVQDASETKTEWVDKFEAKTKDEVLYRLYSPEHDMPRPLVLYLHGGGESGFDNKAQMTGTVGPALIAERYPDVYVMAPQAPGGNFGDMAKRMQRMTFATSDQTGETGWHRKYLAKVCDIIRGMIADGKVNPNRVYVTGLSMGGAGTLRAMSVGNDLFAAAAPICPSMTPETFGILCGLTSAKIWVSCAYVDHTIYRHKYIVDGILALRDAGNNNARLTIYSPEELEAYGLATDPDMPLQARFGQNHACWILTYNNEHGIMDWLMAQTKE